LPSMGEWAKALFVCSASVPKAIGMKAFRAIGAYRVKKGEYRNDLQEFKVEVAAKDEKAAAEKVISTFGSRHRVVRKNIMIKELMPLKEEEITDPVVKHQVGGAK
jgi:large subunit ribosomal protein LX